jgi:hypothetical protein
MADNEISPGAILSGSQLEQKHGHPRIPHLGFLPSRLSNPKAIKALDCYSY